MVPPKSIKTEEIVDCGCIALNSTACSVEGPRSMPK